MIESTKKLISKLIKESIPFNPEEEEYHDRFKILSNFVNKLNQNNLIIKMETDTLSNITNCSLFLVHCEGIPYAAYPHPKQAEVYASGFSKPTLIVEGIFIPKSNNNNKEDKK